MGEITAVLAGLGDETRESWARLIPLVYEELRKLARAYLRSEHVADVLQPTALVHETYVRLSQQRSVEWKNRSHFFGVAAVLMRYILIDQARRARRSEFATRVLLQDVEQKSGAPALEELHEALNRLEAIDPRQCRVIELRYFGGLSVSETAEALGVSERTVRRDWEMARAWLHGELTGS